MTRPARPEGRPPRPAPPADPRITTADKIKPMFTIKTLAIYIRR